MSIRCLLGVHDVIVTGSMFFGFCKLGECTRCEAQFVQDPVLGTWSKQ